MALYLGWWADPIYAGLGDYSGKTFLWFYMRACASIPVLIVNYSDIMKKALVGENEWSQYYEFTAEERAQNNGSSDCFGLNHYGSDIVAYSDHDKYKVTTLAL